jgi:predicted dienelactone hydrolase
MLSFSFLLPWKQVEQTLPLKTGTSFGFVKSLPSNRYSSLWFRLGITLFNIVLGLSLPEVLVTKTLAAEQIYLDYGSLQFSLSVESLEIYAQEGRIEGNLADYAGFFSSEQLEQLRTALVTSIEITPLAVAQFLYSPHGEKILEQVSRLIQTKARQPGFYAIRSALILAAADEEGLTPLNILKKFPTYGIRLNSQKGFEIIENLSSIVQETEIAIAAVEETAQKEMEAETIVDLAPLPQFENPGELTWEKTTLELRDRQRKRNFPVDLYLPKQAFIFARSPLIIISHGLGSDRTTFAYLAKHLASYGFAVAVPEHPRSNASQIQALFDGFANQVTPPRELLDRPLDIKYLLDYLEDNYREKINVRQAGIIGQSFGGYTALALAGAQLNFTQLTEVCPNIDNSLNLSLLLQCSALELPRTEVDVRDERIVAAIAINPLTSAIFGQEGFSQIEIPVMLISGSADPVTPALPEQIKPFTWLTTLDKYLVLLKGGTHFSTLNESSGSIPVPSQAIGPDPKIAQTYLQQLSLIFFNGYVAKELEYQAYLSPDYTAKISRTLMPISLVRSLFLPSSISQFEK